MKTHSHKVPSSINALLIAVIVSNAIVVFVVLNYFTYIP